MANGGRQRVTLAQELDGHLGNIHCLKFGSFSSQTLVTGGEDRKVAVWKLDKKAPISVLQGHASSVESLAIQQVDHLVAGGASCGPIKVWNLAEETVTRTLTGHRDSTISVDFHPGHPALASGSLDGSAKVWDLRQRECVHTIKGHLKGVSSVNFSPDGRWLATGGVEGALMVWDVLSGKKLMELSQRAHDDQILSLVFHPQELLLASASMDKTCKLWDLETNELVASFGQERKIVQTAAFSADGRALLTSHPDSVKVWGWEPTRCYDIVSINCPTSTRTSIGCTADLCTSDDSQTLLRGSLGRNGASIWKVDLQRVEPFGRNDVDDMEHSALGDAPGSHAHSFPALQRPVTAPSSASELPSVGQASSVPLSQTRSFAQEDLAQRISDATPDSADPLPRPLGLRNIRVAVPTETNDVDSGESPQQSGERTPTRPVHEVQKQELHFQTPPPKSTEAMSPRSKEALPDSLPESTEKRRGLASRSRMGPTGTPSAQLPFNSRNNVPVQQDQISSPAVISATKRGALSPIAKKNRTPAAPRFLEPTAASRQRALAKTMETSAAATARLRNSSRPQVDGRGSSDSSRSSPVRRPSVGRRTEHRRGAVASSPAAADKRRTIPSSPKRAESSKRGERLGRGSGSTTVPVRPFSSTGTEKKPWTPSASAQHKRQTTPERSHGSSQKEQESEKRRSTSILRLVNSSSNLASQGQPLPSVLGQTAWTVPWASGSSDCSTAAGERTSGEDGPFSNKCISMYDDTPVTALPPLVLSVRSPEQAQPSQEAARALPPGYRGSGAFGSPVKVEDQQQGTPAGSAGNDLQEPTESDSPEQQMPAGASGNRISVSPGKASQSPGLSKLSVLTPTTSSAKPGNCETPPAGPNTPVTPLQGEDLLGGAVSDSSRELSPLDPNASMTPVSPLSSSEGLESESSGARGGLLPGTVASVRGGKVSGQASRSGTRPMSPNGRRQGVLGSPRLSGAKASTLKVPDLQRASGSGNYEHAVPSSLLRPGRLDIAAFAASCNASEEPIAQRASSSGSMDPDTLQQQVQEQHSLVIQTMTTRKTRLQEAKLLWAGGEVQGMLRLLTTLKDPSVLVDILNALLTSDRDTPTHMRLRGSAVSSRKSAQRWQSIGLAGCADLLPLLPDLLESPQSIYSETCLLALEDILACFGDTIRGIHSTSFAPGVDLHAEERRAHCQRCVLNLRSMETALAGLTRKLPDDKANLAKTVHSKLLAVVSAR